MKNNWIKVYAFTLKNSGITRKYVATTLIVALLLAALIPAGMVLADRLTGDGAALQPVTAAYVVGADDLASVSSFGGEYSDVTYETANSIQAAAEACAGDVGAVIVLVEGNEITAITPHDSNVTVETAAGYAAWLSAMYPYALLAEAGAQLPDMPMLTDEAEAANEADETLEMVNEIIEMLVPYVVVMLMYFMVLIYGQGVANSAIMEKTSKLMDLFLVSVKPAALITGKVLAMATAGLVQAVAWLASAVGGCALGGWLVRTLNPNTTLAILSVFDSAAGIAAMFDPAALLMAALTIVAGFLVYCALAGIGGALASKPEDLSSSNYLFTLALMISFFICLFSGESAGMISDAPWMAYVPFTAVLVMPGRLLTGAASPLQGLVSVAISGVCAVALMAFAGKVYASMAFYRGKPVAPLKLIRGLLTGRGK